MNRRRTCDSCSSSPASTERSLWELLRTAPAPARAAIVVGPEGGWEPSECAAAQSRGLRLVSLGGRTLRADAVPIAALSVLQFLWDQPC